MLAAIVFTAVVVIAVTVVVAFCIGVIVELAFKECFNCFICIAFDAAVNADSDFAESDLCTRTDAAADKNTHSDC